MNHDRNQSLALLVRDFALAVSRYRAAATDRDIGLTEMVALGHLYANGPLTPGELAAELVITSASATELIDRLEEVGYAHRRAHLTDRRKRLVDLTSNGRKAATTLYSDFGARTAMIYGMLTSSQQEGVERFLTEVIAQLERPAPVDPTLEPPSESR
ncbi:MarR family winged helix-turn-helix transcriptional regulator [Rhodococcus tibetensis]|uniref:MarR family transcriptional regulator n=1 Tax=Rhodococcus tibetensis TaxID=2965064 RepID=A0ABT1QIM3_9NOCA|nr:MarR family transcriptional regulator [Rhodococcus sp. FXJ9.536]MCQ4120940.1 MarR family transcriptional regulator [Rhodococcus sp. FXJ9.536]